jgi:hypothetical protein
MVEVFVFDEVSGIQMKSWTEKALETVNCFAFLKCKLTVVIRAPKIYKQKISVFFSFFAMFYIKNRITKFYS